jgi:D-galactose 1-dehydrogenase
LNPLRIAIVGFGKIARDQHLSAIAATEGTVLAAVASPNASLAGVPHVATLDELLRDGPPIDAVALCTPPQVRRGLAATALAAGKHVMLEKPPGATIAEIRPLLTAAHAAQKTLFATWHSRFAAAIEPARQLLIGRRITAVRISWKEDVKVWHPGQARSATPRDCRSRPNSIFAKPARRTGISTSTPIAGQSPCPRAGPD